MPESQVIDILEAQCRTEDEEIVNKWYNEFHMPVLFKSGKLCTVSRYKVMGGSPDIVRFFTICKYDSEETFKEFLASPEFEAAGEKSPEMKSVKINNSPPIHCELIKEWSR